MSSASSTETATGRDAGMRPWHFFLIVAMVGATWAVIESRHTQPAALLLLSAAVIAAGLVAIAIHQTLAGFWRTGQAVRPLAVSDRRALEEEKAAVLRSIKELEFDYGMKKIGEADFKELSGRLRAKAVGLIEQLDRAEVTEKAAKSTTTAGTCAACHTINDADARFCKACGHKL